MVNSKQQNIISISINNFGPFDYENKLNFSDEITKCKICIYGQNGSGKTTISRLFNCFENQEFPINDYVHNALKPSKFEFKFADEAACTVNCKNKQANISNNSKFLFHVFNSDYVSKNISINKYVSSDKHTGYIVGQRTIESKQIEQELINTRDDIKRNKQIISDQIKDINETLDKYKISKNLNERKNINFASISDENNKNTTKTVTYENYLALCIKLKKLDDIDIEENINLQINKHKFSDHENLTQILKSSYSDTKFTDDFIKDFASKKYFIEAGLSYMTSSKSVCPFCHQKLDDSAKILINKYNDYRKQETNVINTKLEAYKNDIDALIKDIEETEKSIKGYIPQIKTYRDIFDLSFDIPKPYSLDPVNVLSNKVIGSIDKKIENLAIVYSENSCINDFIKELTSINTYYEEFNKIIREINHNILSHSTKRKNLCKTICQAAIQNLISSNNDIFNEIKKLENKESYLVDRLNRNSNRINKEELIRQKFKKILTIYFNDKYQYDEKNNSILLYGNDTQNRLLNILSDGEKRIIAFTWYLAEIHACINKEGDYENLFFVIDDPVTSMDFDYVFTTAQLIRSLNKAINTKKNRILLLTHNFEFFRIVASNKITNTNYYLSYNKISKIEPWKLNPYIFHLSNLLKFIENNDQEEIKFNIPNSMRYVLETIMHFECYSKRLEDYIMDDEILSENLPIYTFCNELSHGNYMSNSPIQNKTIIRYCECVISFVKNKFPEHINIAKNLINHIN